MRDVVSEYFAIYITTLPCSQQILDFSVQIKTLQQKAWQDVSPGFQCES